jgi:HTH-type transcriptional regulator/antitoxin HigA
MQKLSAMVNAIKNKTQHERALKRIYQLMQADIRPGSKDENELEVLSILVEAYERGHFAITPPHPIEAIKFRLEQLGIDSSELSKILGYRSRKSEILSGRRKLTLRMIRSLHRKLKIPAESLIGEY